MRVWTRILECVADKVSRQSYETWFEPIRFESCTARSLWLTVPDEHFRSVFPAWLLKVLHDAVYDVTHTRLKVYMLAAAPARHGVGVLREWGQVILLCMREAKYKAEYRTVRASRSKAPMNLFAADTVADTVSLLKPEATAESVLRNRTIPEGRQKHAPIPILLGPGAGKSQLMLRAGARRRGEALLLTATISES